MEKNEAKVKQSFFFFFLKVVVVLHSFTHNERVSILIAIHRSCSRSQQELT
jgi:hypothetical protein